MSWLQKRVTVHCKILTQHNRSLISDLYIETKFVTVNDSTTIIVITSDILGVGNAVLLV